MDTFTAIMEYRDKICRWEIEKSKKITETMETLARLHEERIALTKKNKDLANLLEAIDPERWKREQFK